MAVALNTVFENAWGSQTSPAAFVSNTGTTPGTVAANANRVLIAFMCFSWTTTGPSTVAVTWAGNAMTQIGSAVVLTAKYAVYCFGLHTDASITTGNQTISGSWTGGDATMIALDLGAICFDGADQTDGWVAAHNTSGNATANPATLTVTTTSGNAVAVGGCNDNGAAPSISSGTSGWMNGGFNGNYFAGYALSDASSEVISWTTGVVEYGLIGVDVLAVGAGGGGDAQEWMSRNAPGKSNRFFHTGY